MKYIHFYDVDAQFKADYNGEAYGEPWVSFVLEAERVDYNKPDYSKELLKFHIISGGTLGWKTNTTAFTRTIEFKKNDGDWQEVISAIGTTGNSNMCEVEAGDVVTVRGKNTNYGYVNGSTRNSCYFSCNPECRFVVNGNIMSLIDYDNFKTMDTIETDYAFYRTFQLCSGISDAGDLILPATNLSVGAYYNMFGGVRYMVTGPKSLPAKNVPAYAYQDMYYGCFSVTGAPEMQAETVGTSGMSNMFSYCSSLTKVYDFKLQTVGDGGIAWMFFNCKSLVNAPEHLPATSITTSSYEAIFNGCISLQTVPEIGYPSTSKLPNYCFRYTFNGCTSLAEVPSNYLPFTGLSTGCYLGMFGGCSSLTNMPNLPATTLYNSCYSGMCKSCTSLTTAAVLPAQTLTTSCYSGMFSGCTNLSYIKCLATGLTASNALTGWVQGVSATGTFVKNTSVETWPSGVNGIPTGWTVENAIQ